MTGAQMGPSSRVRLGIVGLGSVFEPYATLIPELRYEGRIEVVSTCDVVASRARRVQDFLHQEAPFTTDYADVVGRDDVDAVLVLTAMPSHGETTYAEVDPAWPWTAGLRHLVDCVLDDAELLIRPEHAYHCLEVMVKAQAAASSGDTQEVSSRIGPLPYDPDAIYVQRGGKTGHDYRIRRHRDG